MSVIDTTTKTVSAVINSHVPYPFGGLAISPDGTKLYLTGIATSNNLPVVAIIDTANNQVTDTIELLQRDWNPGQPAITPNGKFLYVPVYYGGSRPNNDLVVMIRTATQKRVTHIVVGTQPTSVSIAPNGKYAYVANLIDGTVSVIDITPK